MVPTIRSCSSVPASAVEESPARFQSMGAPSAIAAATSSTGRGSAVTLYHLGEMNQRTSNAETRSLRARTADCLGDLLVAVAELEPRDEQFALDLGQLLQCGVVPFDHLRADRIFQRRSRSIRHRFVKRSAGRLSCGAAQLVTNAVEDALAQIRLQRAFVRRVELIETTKCLDHGVLHQILRVGAASDPLRQPATRPT